MSLFKKMRDELARRAAQRTVESAKQSARGAAKRIELALFGDGPEEEAKRIAAEAEEKRKADEKDGGELGRYAARKRREEEEAAAVESELAAMKKKMKDKP